MNLEIREATEKEIPLLQNLARESWATAYRDILSSAQIRYMLDKMYAAEILKTQIKSGSYPYYIVWEEGKAQGFLALEIQPDSQTVKLQKLYLLEAGRGKGLGEKLLGFAENQAKKLGATKITLNVNKQNPALKFYLKNGFMKKGEGIFDIGGGFVMDDFLLTKNLSEAN